LSKQNNKTIQFSGRWYREALVQPTKNNTIAPKGAWNPNQKYASI